MSPRGEFFAHPSHSISSRPTTPRVVSPSRRCNRLNFINSGVFAFIGYAAFHCVSSAFSRSHKLHLERLELRSCCDGKPSLCARIFHMRSWGHLLGVPFRTDPETQPAESAGKSVVSSIEAFMAGQVPSRGLLDQDTR